MENTKRNWRQGELVLTAHVAEWPPESIEAAKQIEKRLVYDASGRLVASCEREDEAELIVLAVNCYDDLVEAAEIGLRVANIVGKWKHCREKIKAALAKAGVA